MQQIKSFIHLIKSLHDKKSCREFLEKYRWQGIPICPHCKCQSEKHYKLKFGGEFNGLYKCRECKNRFTVTIGTIFEGSNVPLEKWFYAIYLFLSHKKGISSIQLSKDIDVTQKTAWFMLSRIRYNLKNTEDVILNSFEGEVQIDETYVGGKNKGRIWQNQGRSLKQKIPVVGMLTDDKVYALVVKNADGNTLKGIVYAFIKPGATVVTDGWKGYCGISNMYNHKIVEHSKGSYVNKEGFHTNGIEGFWSHLKRGIKGIYHSVSHKYLQYYCNEFAYRYNTRKISDGERFIQFTTSMHKRLRYSNLIYEPIRS
jgi:transposase-like protein